MDCCAEQSHTCSPARHCPARRRYCGPQLPSARVRQPQSAKEDPLSMHCISRGSSLHDCNGTLIVQSQMNTPFAVPKGEQCTAPEEVLHRHPLWRRICQSPACAPGQGCCADSAGGPPLLWDARHGGLHVSSPTWTCWVVPECSSSVCKQQRPHGKAVNQSMTAH